MAVIRGIRFKKFLEETKKEKKELDKSYKQSLRNKKDRTTSKKIQEKLKPLSNE